MSGPGESLASMLKVERRGDDEFVVRLEDFWGASMGCDVLARASLAAVATCAGKELYALQASFFDSAPAAVPLQLRVERLSDQDQIAHRLVRVRHGERSLCDVILTFAAPGGELAYQGVRPEGDLPRADAVPSTLERARAEGWEEYARGPVEFRRVGAEWPWPKPSPSETSHHREWLRPRQPLPGDASMQMAALVFASDFYSHWTASDRLGADFAPNRFTSLDHALWIHRHLPWDGWWLLDAASEVGHAGRMLTRRRLFTDTGILIASAVQSGRYL